MQYISENICASNTLPTETNNTSNNNVIPVENHTDSTNTNNSNLDWFDVITDDISQYDSNMIKSNKPTSINTIMHKYK